MCCMSPYSFKMCWNTEVGSLFVVGGAIHRRDVSLPASAAGSGDGRATPRAHHGRERHAPRNLATDRRQVRWFIKLFVFVRPVIQITSIPRLPRQHFSRLRVKHATRIMHSLSVTVIKKNNLASFILFSIISITFFIITSVIDLSVVPIVFHLSKVNNYVFLVQVQSATDKWNLRRDRE